MILARSLSVQLAGKPSNGLSGVAGEGRNLSVGCQALPKKGLRGGFELRHLLNGLVDGYLYDSGRIDATLPFEELRRRSLINEAARAADGAPDFSQRIRTSLPTMPH